MRWMTLAWWRGEAPNDEVFAQYHAHFDAIRHRLPAELRDYDDRVTLHDSRLLRLDVDVARQRVEMVLIGEDWRDYRETGKYPSEACRWLLRYDGVTHVRTKTELDGGLGGPDGFGHLGYDEIDLGEDGAIIHRLLFSSAIELEIVFGGLSARMERE